MGGPAVSDPVAEFLAGLGHAVQITNLDADSIAPRLNGVVRRLRLLCHYSEPDPDQPFQIYHLELRDRHPTKALLDPICRASPQASFLFVIDRPPRPMLTLVHPRPAAGRSGQYRYRSIRLTPGRLTDSLRSYVDSLRVSPHETDGEYLHNRVCRTFDAWERNRSAERENFGESELFWLFLAELGRYPVLPPDEQRRLLQRVHQGGPEAEEARRRLTCHNLRLVVSVARPFQRGGLPLLDLIQEGFIGLLQAIEKYNPSYNTQFSTYAVWWIRQSVLRAIADKSHLIRLPAYLFGRINFLERLARSIGAWLGREPTLEELALEAANSLDKTAFLSETERLVGWYCQYLGLAWPSTLQQKLARTQSYIWRLWRWARQPLSLDYTSQEWPANVLPDPEALAEDYSSGELLPLVSPVNHGPEAAGDHAGLHQALTNALSGLTERERGILCMRYGLADGKACTLEEVGQVYEVTRERVRQIEAKAFRKLRHPACSHALRGFLLEQGLTPPKAAPSRNGKGPTTPPPATEQTYRKPSQPAGSNRAAQTSHFAHSVPPVELLDLPPDCLPNHWASQAAPEAAKPGRAMSVAGLFHRRCRFPKSTSGSISLNEWLSWSEQERRQALALVRPGSSEMRDPDKLTPAAFWERFDEPSAFGSDEESRD